MDRIARNSTKVVCPVIDLIHEDTFALEFDQKSVQVGGFDWGLQVIHPHPPPPPHPPHPLFLLLLETNSKKPVLSSLGWNLSYSLSWQSMNHEATYRSSIDSSVIF